jgi:hypothetical protein
VADITSLRRRENAEDLLRHVRYGAPRQRSSTSACRRRTPTKRLVAAQQVEATTRRSASSSRGIEPSWRLAAARGASRGVGYLLKERVFDVAILVDALRRITDGDRRDQAIVSRLLGRAGA